MVRYRRHFVPGGTYFFTVALQDRHSRLLVVHIDALRRAFRETADRLPFRTDAIVVLPDHLHSVWTLPPGDADFPTRWRAIKSRFVRHLRQAGCSIPVSGRGEALVWQRRYWEHAIRDDADLRNHVDYIHYNPVRHGLVASPIEWPYSSLHRLVAQGQLPADWASAPDDGAIGACGEPVPVNPEHER